MEVLTAKGVSEEGARAIVDTAERKNFVTKRPDGGYELNHGQLGHWGNDSALAELHMAGIVDFNDPEFLVEFRKKLMEALSANIAEAEKNIKADEKIRRVKELIKGLDPATESQERRRILKRWNKGSLALLILLLGPAFLRQVTADLEPHEERALRNYLIFE